MGFKVSPPEAVINFMGYNAIGNKQYTKAASFFEWNIANYPNSGNVYDSYGDLFAAKKDTLNAIINYKKALAISANAESKQKLDALEGKQVRLSEQELQRFLGKFDFETITLTATTFLKDSVLWVNAPGQGEFEMVPVAPNTFALKNMSGYRVRFDMDGDKLVGLTSLQPDGAYKAHVKK
jgi:tetratricopeptide (TPR) repeat protein